MGFQITLPTDVPLAGDGSHDSPTWGEGAGPWSVPPQKTNGLVSELLASNLLNYEYQHDARWLRALRDRVALSDEGLLTTCVLSQGTWNTAGGTLDVTLTPTRLVVDVNGDGGIVIEIKAPVGSPETLTALRDTYVDFDEAGGYTLVAVPNGDPEPAVTVGHARVYKLVTDGIELTSTGLVQGVAPFPCFGPQTGIVEANITTANIATANIGTLDVSGDATFDMDVIVGNEVIVTSAVSCSELAVTGQVTISGPVFESAPVYNYTHAAAADWRDSVRPSVRTFAVAGTVAPGGETTKTPITAATGSQALFSINDLTPTTNSAFVAFDVAMQIVWSNDANPPTGGAGLATSITWTDVASYNAGTWGSTTNGAQVIVGAALGGSVVSLELDSGQIVMQIAHDLGVENRGYRWAATIRGRVIELAT